MKEGGLERISSKHSRALFHLPRALQAVPRMYLAME